MCVLLVCVRVCYVCWLEFRHAGMRVCALCYVGVCVCVCMCVCVTRARQA